MRRWRRWALVVGGAFVSTLAAVAGPGVAWGGGGGGCHSPLGGGPGQPGTVVEMKASCFGPAALRVPAPSTVEFVNRDPVPHVVMGTGWGSAEYVQPGGRSEFRLSEPGVYPYSCFLHPGMNGAVVVGDDVGTARLVSKRSQEPAPSDLLTEPRSPASRLPFVVASPLLVPAAFLIGHRRGSRRRETGSR